MNGSEAVLYRIKKEFLVKKKLNISVLGAGALLLLSACGRSDVTSHSTGLWERLILMFGKAIQGFYWIRYYYFHDFNSCGNDSSL